MDSRIFNSLSAADYLVDLEDACCWLSIKLGRTIEYKKRLEAFSTKKTHDEIDLLSYFESSDLVEIYLLWEKSVDYYPGLKNHIRTIFKKGPTLRSDENPNRSTNRPRNNAFPVLLAGRFLAAGIHVNQVEGNYQRPSSIASNADFTFLRRGSEFNVECKRPYSMKGLVNLAEEARDQIVLSPRNGIIALDCSRLIHDQRTVFDNSGRTRAEAFGLNHMEHNVLPSVQDMLCTRVSGILLYCRIPAMTPMMKQKSTPQVNRRDSSVSLLCMPNTSYSTDVEMMRDIYEKLIKGSHERRLTLRSA